MGGTGCRGTLELIFAVAGDDGRMRKRQLRFSLRFMLIATTAFTVWFGLQLNFARQQRAAVNRIREVGGFVYYDFQVDESGKEDLKAVPWEPTWLLNVIGVDFFHGVKRVNLVYGKDPKTGGRVEVSRNSDKYIREVANFRRLEWLLMAEGQATDEAMRYVAQLPNLKRLYMWDASELTDAGVEKLSGLRKLEYVHISNSRITDQSVKYLGDCRRMEGLSMQGNRFSNDCLLYASHMPSLKQLVIGRGEITIDDAGLEYLKELPNLERLGLQGADLSADGVRRLMHLKQLKELWIDEHKVGRRACDELEEAIPGLKVT